MNVWLSTTLVLSLVGCVTELIWHAGAHEVTGTGVPAAVLIWGAAVGWMFLGSIRFGPIAGLPNNTKTRVGGLLTYPLYLIHDLTGAAALRVMAEIGLPRWFALPAALCFVVSLAWIVTLMVEPVIHGVLRNGFVKLETRLAGASALRRLFTPSRPLETLAR